MVTWSLISGEVDLNRMAFELPENPESAPMALPCSVQHLRGIFLRRVVRGRKTNSASFSHALSGQDSSELFYSRAS